MKIDNLNEQILQIITKQGRIANTELAEQVGLSPSACLRRVQEMESNGLIKGYKAILDAEKNGINFIAYVNIGLNEHSTKSQQAFEKAIKTANEVKECHNITGAFEYLLRVETHNLKSFKRFHANILGEIPQVRTIATHVVMDSPKDERA